MSHFLLEHHSAQKGSSTYVSVIPDLREIDLFEWQEMSKRDIAKKWPSQWAAWGADPARFMLPESGKKPVVDLWRRAETVWGEIRGAPPGFAAPSLDSDTCAVVDEADGDLEDPKCRCVTKDWEADRFQKGESSRCILKHFSLNSSRAAEVVFAKFVEAVSVIIVCSCRLTASA